MIDFYFGYGSNLDAADWARYCAVQRVDPEVLRPLGPAVLPGETLVFDYRSDTRGCGALNIRACPDKVVDGYLFAVAPDGWAALDHKEGHPHRYARETVRVVDAGGRAVTAQTYRVVPAMRIGFCPPDAEYLAICRAGRQRLGLSCAQLDAAAVFCADEHESTKALE